MTTRLRWNLVRILLTTVYLFLGWLLFTWSVSARAMVIGILQSAVVALLTYPVFIQDDEAARRSQLPRVHILGVYLIVLVFNMYVASFRVLWQILRGNINPGIVHFRTRLSSDIARLALSNAITITPGTITLQLDDDHLIVHWLDARTTHSTYAGKLIKGTYEKLLSRVWV